MEIRKIQAKKPRVALMLQDWFPAYGGEQVLVARLAVFLVEEGYEVDILTRGGKGKLSKDEKELEKLPGLRVKRMGPLFLLLSFLHLLLHGKKYALVHAHSTGAAMSMKAASWITRVPSLFTVHNNHVFEKRWSLRKILDRIMSMETLFSQEISISERFLKAVNVNEHVLVIPPGVDVHLFDEVETQAKKGFNILYVGRLEYSKGLDVLLKIMNKIDGTLHIVGEGPEETRLRNQAANLINVTFHGKKTGEARRKLYKNADCFVLPSRVDGLPYELLEACAAGLPILATDVGDHRKVVLENTNGHLVHPDDPEELAYYLGQFASNPHLKEMGLASYELVEQEYDWTEMLEKNLRVYEQLQRPKEGKEYKIWDLPGIWLKQQRFKDKKVSKKKLKFCLTVDLEAADHSLEYLEEFFEHYEDFCKSSDLKSSLFITEEVLNTFKNNVLEFQTEGHEIGVKAVAEEWQDGPERKKTLRRMHEMLSEQGWKDVRMFRAPTTVSDKDLDAIHQMGFESLPVTEDPKPHIDWESGVPSGQNLVMDLNNFLELSQEELLEAVIRIRTHQEENGMPPYVIFQASSWELRGENFSELSRRLAFLKENMKVEFLTLSEFCKSCSVTA